MFEGRIVQNRGIHLLEIERHLRMDNLDWVARGRRGDKRRAQRRVPGRQLLESASQGCRIQRRADAHHAWHVVRGALRRQLVQEPERLLAVRKRRLGRGRLRGGLRRRSGSLRQVVENPRGQFSGAASLEKFFHRQGDLQV